MPLLLGAQVPYLVRDIQFTPCTKLSNGDSVVGL